MADSSSSDDKREPTLSECADELSSLLEILGDACSCDKTFAIHRLFITKAWQKATTAPHIQGLHEHVLTVLSHERREKSKKSKRGAS